MKFVANKIFFFAIRLLTLITFNKTMTVEAINFFDKIINSTIQHHVVRKVFCSNNPKKVTFYYASTNLVRCDDNKNGNGKMKKDKNESVIVINLFNSFYIASHAAVAAQVYFIQ
jgi:hypothetical protein